MKIIACLLAIVLLAPPAGGADSGRSEWPNLTGLRAGQGVEVLKQNREWVKGAFVSFSEDSLNLRAKKQDTIIARADVRQVRLPKGHKRLWIGLGVGAAAGAGIGAAAADRLANESGGDFAGIKPAVTALIAGMGALIGLLVGSLVGGHTTVYEAP
jgi:hypothetical protein